jgi:KDO2-lipid IV(A) lauroyltransferase
MANDQKFIPVYFETKKINRGFYEIILKEYEQEIATVPYGSITEWHTRLLEKTIQGTPEFWLWSHKRWKRQVPINLKELKLHQEERFNKRFRKV